MRASGKGWCNVWLGGWLFVIVAMGSGCGAATGLETGDGSGGTVQCNPDEVVTCACPDFAKGTQACRKDRTFTPCRCDDAGAGDLDASLKDVSPVDADIRHDGSGPIGGGPGSGEITCGVMNPTTCSIAAGESCCILDPGIDRCFGSGESCSCTGPSCRITVASCDGPEDCPSGQVCCGTFSAGAYSSIACKASCKASSERELCHPGENACSRPSQTCSPSPSLPEGYYRCE